MILVSNPWYSFKQCFLKLSKVIRSEVSSLIYIFFELVLALLISVQFLRKKELQYSEWYLYLKEYEYDKGGIVIKTT